MKKKLVGIVASAALVCSCVPTAAFAYTNVTSWSSNNGKTSFVYHDSTKVKVSGVKHLAVDVSEHNGTINWKKAKADGIEYAIIRCGFGWDKKRTDRKNGSQEDYQFVTNVKNARAAGLKVGVYLYSYAWSKTTATKEAEFVLKLLKKAGLTPSNMDLPVYYDLEETNGTSGPCVPEKNSRGQVIDSHKISNKTLASMANAFCTTIKAAGYRPGVYASTNWWNKYLTSSVFENWGKWVAQYGKSCSYSGKKAAWQFTSKGKVSGIGSKTDVSFFYNTYAAKSKYKVTYKLNGGTNSSSNPKYYYTTKSYTLKNATRLGYTFKGWYKSSTYTTQVTTIKKGSKGNKTFYAKWAARTTAFKVAVVPSTGLNVRETASTDAKAVAYLKQGAQITISKVSKDWGRLSDGSGWVSLKYCKAV